MFICKDRKKRGVYRGRAGLKRVGQYEVHATKGVGRMYNRLGGVVSSIVTESLEMKVMERGTDCLEIRGSIGVRRRKQSRSSFII